MNNNDKEEKVAESKKPYAEFKKRHPAIQLLIGALGLIAILIVLSMFW